MALKAFIKDLSAVDEAQQALYKQTEGGFILDVDPVGGIVLEDVTQLKNSLQNARNDYDTARNTLKSFGELDPKEVLEKLERYEKLKELNPERLKKELAQEQRELIGNEYKTKIEEANSKVESMKAAVKKAAMAEVYGAIAQTGANPVFLEGYISKVADVEFNDDGYNLVFKNNEGKPRFNIDNTGQTTPFTTKDLIKELQTDETYGQIFPSTSNSGGGGQKTYQQDKKGVKFISPADKGKYQEEIAAGTVEVKYS